MIHSKWQNNLALQRDPEKLNNRSADMWSFGVLLWEVNTHLILFVC